MDFRLIKAPFSVVRCTRLPLILFLATIFAFGARPEKLRLIGADRLVQTTRNDVTVKKLTGNVHFRKGAVDLTCDLAYWFEKDEKADFYHNVYVTKQDQVLEADTLSYFAAAEIIVANGHCRYRDADVRMTARQLRHYVEDDFSEAKGNVRLDDDKRTVTADYLLYYSENKQAIALDNASIFDPGRDTWLYGDSLVYFNATENIEATRNPYIVKLDSSGRENFRIKGDVIRGYEQRGRFVSIGNVKIWRDDFSAYSDELEYYDSLEVAEMIGKPKVYRDGQNLSGERMKLQMRDEILESLLIFDNAVAASKSKAYYPYDKTDSAAVADRDSVRVYDEITGKYMEIYFKEGETDSIRVSGMATSYYNVTEDSIIQGVNIASGDTVIMKFEDKKLNHIVVIGGAEGKYIPDKTNTSVDTTVFYAAERIDYFLRDKNTFLRDESSIQSSDMELTAGKIQIEWNSNLLYAFPLEPPPYDSLSTDLPTLYQTGREPFSGDEMIYNMKTKKGRIVEGKTKEQDGYYYGEDISKVNKREFYVRNGVYTTCDIEDAPHYYFKSPKMKLIHKDKIIAKPIIFYIHDIPLLALPFGIFPNKGGGRHSGWLMPTYGESSRDGGYFRGLGYFWAPNDYYDLKLTLDFYDRVGIVSNYRTRYKLRYVFDGSISGKYTDQFFSDYGKREWTLNIRHNHKLSPTMKLVANGSFVSSDDLYRRLSFQQNDRLKQQLISNATLSKSWPGKPYSLSMTLKQTINLQAQNLTSVSPTGSGQKVAYISRLLPSVSFSRSSKPLIPQKSGSSSGSGRWYNNIYFGVSSQLRNNQNISYLSSLVNDSLLWEQQDITQNAVTHNISLNSSQRVLKYITLNQSMGIQEGWITDYDMPVYDSAGAFVFEDGKIVTVPVHEFRARHTGNVSINAQTKLYGLFPIRLGALQMLRHVVTPSVGFSYRPDFSEDIYGWDPGYIETWRDSSGYEWRYDPFRTTLLGSTPTGESKSMTFSLNNLFQAKLLRGEEERKIDNLLTLNVNTRHNFAADSLRWAPISTSIRTQLSRKLVLNVNTSHDLYAYNNGRIDEWNDEWHGIPIPRLTSVSASTGFALSGRRFGAVKSAEAFEDTSGIDDEILGTIDTDIEEQTTFSERSEGDELWSANFSLRYSLARSNPEIKRETFWMSTNVKINLNSKWKIGWNASFDLLEKNMVSQRFSISRDLHCWQLTFNWTPSKYSYANQYNLTIHVKSPTLRDLKYEERGGRSSGFGM
jgi:lipopolysaccharide assembly outer membrane protein LptD (OstA)